MSAGNGKRPNVLWICTDQQRFDTIGALGNRYVHTPNLDHLVETGTAFTRTYCQNPICTPSRASFLTGRYPSAVNVNVNGNEFFPREAEDILVSRILSDTGYYCGLVGKLHLAGCADRAEPRVDDGFKVFEWSHSPRPLWDGTDHAYAAWLVDKGQDPKKILHLRDKRKDRAIVPSPDRDNVAPEFHHLTWLGERAVNYIHTARDPWLLCVNAFEPHPPFNPPWEYYRRFDPASMPGPLFRPEDLRNQGALEKAGVQFQTSARDPADFGGQELQAAYYASIEFVDYQIGLMLEALRATNQLENTIVIFMSDHGEMLGDHGLVQKGCRFYEGLVRVPLVFSWPGAIPEQRQVAHLVELTDVAPTILELTGCEVPERMQGYSLTPAFDGNKDSGSGRRAVRSEYFQSLGMGDRTRATMYFDGKWKLVRYHSAGLGELFDLIEDPREFVNLWDDPKARAVRDELLLRSYDDTIKSLDVGVPSTRHY